MIALPPDVTALVCGLYQLGRVVLSRDPGARAWSVRIVFGRGGCCLAHAVGSLAETIVLARRLSSIVARHGDRPRGPRFWREVEREVSAHHRRGRRAQR